MDTNDLWAKLAAPLPAGVIAWRQDGKPAQRDGKYFARFVAYIEANTVRERLDGCCPGSWDLTLELLPPLGRPDAADGGDAACSFKARLQILGVIREDVGTGRDYKQAATDAFKRAAVRFGVAHELYAYEQNWVQVDGDGRYAKPLEDPQVAYVRRYGTGNGAAKPAAPAAPAAALTCGACGTQYRGGACPTCDLNSGGAAPASEPHPEAAERESRAQEAADNPVCPKCGGRMWDNRATKRNAKAPDFKCRDRACDGVIWPPKGQGTGNGRRRQSEPEEISLDSSPLGGGMDDIPF